MRPRIGDEDSLPGSGIYTPPNDKQQRRNPEASAKKDEMLCRSCSVDIYHQALFSSRAGFTIILEEKKFAGSKPQRQGQPQDGHENGHENGKKLAMKAKAQRCNRFRPTRATQVRSHTPCTRAIPYPLERRRNFPNAGTESKSSNDLRDRFAKKDEMLCRSCS